MAAPTARSPGDRLRDVADRLYALAERWDTPTRTLAARQALHDDTENAAGDVRAVVRGNPGRPVNPPLEISADGRRCGW
ncbi:hypothetical protein PX554_13730 [Sphingomonas sp. H39-1-10]|uniref:hypothetical protein n=1 Tax=Sphingomonas pollutisoli TaxID=3030829 RepID=UPI0023B9B748|nr:hypothetical protein [Sphingomonas pollutisoli]MDF0489196.1 hypothetical protein [Sphingomonas pollutisoli]